MTIFKDKYLRVIFALSLILLFFSLIFAYSQLANTSGPLIIHFDAYSGIDFFGGRLEIFGILISTLAIVFINGFLADFLYNRERFLSYLLGFGSLGLSILILIAASVIISVN